MMAFKGTQGPDLVSLALNIMQMKRDREMDERKLAIEEFRAQNDAKIAQNKNILEMLKLTREATGAEKKAGADLAPTLSVAADDTAPMADRAPAARTYLSGLMQEAQFRAGPGNRVTGDILNQVGNEAASAGSVTRATAQPNLDWEYDSAGNKRRVKVFADGSMTPVPGAVWVPPKAGVTVNVGGKDGLDLNQQATVSDRERSKFAERMAPFEAMDNAISTLESFRGMADKYGMLPYEASQFVSSDVMASLRGEALNEGDVRRLTAVGFMNTAREWLGVPAQMSVAQLDTIAQIIRDRAARKEKKRQSLIREGVRRAEAFGFDPYLVVGDYVDYRSPNSKMPPKDKKITSGMPAGTTVTTPTVVIPGGSDPRFPRIVK